MRTDLLLAADSLTSAMSSLVHQLNTGKKRKKTKKINNFSLYLEENKPLRRYNYRPYEYGNRIDDEQYFTSDDDDNDRAYYFSPIDRKSRENRLFI